jgi:hypothetical protein
LLLWVFHVLAAAVASSLWLDWIRPSAFVELRRDKQAEHYPFRVVSAVTEAMADRRLFRG